MTHSSSVLAALRRGKKSTILNSLGLPSPCINRTVSSFVCLIWMLFTFSGCRCIRPCFRPAYSWRGRALQHPPSPPLLFRRHFRCSMLKMAAETFESQGVRVAVEGCVRLSAPLALYRGPLLSAGDGPQLTLPFVSRAMPNSTRYTPPSSSPPRSATGMASTCSSLAETFRYLLPFQKPTCSRYFALFVAFSADTVPVGCAQCR